LAEKARVAELVDAYGSGPYVRKDVGVQLSPLAHPATPGVDLALDLR